LKNKTDAAGAIHNGKLLNRVGSLLLPELPQNSAAVTDNAAFHERADIQDLIEGTGHTIFWLPPYRPDFNPVEKYWARIKKIRQDWRLDCIDTLFFYFMRICTVF
ncbi:transposase, partial [Neisseria iguanae]